jgi:acyl dehydratase
MAETLRFDDIELGDDLPVEHPDLSLASVTRFTEGSEMRFPRFLDHEAARAEGLPGALVPGLMSQGFLLALLHRWAPGCTVHKIDTVFRGPLVVETTAEVTGAVTDIDEDAGTVEVDLTVVDDNGRTVVVGTAIVEPST